MWPFSSRKKKSSTKEENALINPIREGDLVTVRKLLYQGVNPNIYYREDNPIHFALHQGPEMVQILIDHGADVNTPSHGFMPLAMADALDFERPEQGYNEIASILRKAGALLRADNDFFLLDPRHRIIHNPKISYFIILARMSFPTASPEQIAEKVESKIDCQHPPYAPLTYLEQFRKAFSEYVLFKWELTFKKGLYSNNNFVNVCPLLNAIALLSD